MKEKMHILVPTDFSPASRAGVRFAIQWSRQQNVHLVFVHVMNLVRLTRWNDQQYESFASAESAFYQKKLATFIADVQRRLPMRPNSWSSILLEGLNADIALMDYCREHPEIRLVCMGTKGAGGTRRLFGTNTGNFILHADTPVIAVPAAYRRKPISRVVYASDLADAIHELKQVVGLAKPLHAKVWVLHLKEAGEMTLDPASLKQVWKKESGYNLTVEFRKPDASLSVARNLEQTARSLHPSLMMLFSNRRRTVFQNLFYPSNAERLAFDTKIPLLVMGKAD
jgi:nucleotide-binding universal stress UspA family protein